MDSLRSGTRWVVGGRRGPILRSQAKEVRGSTDDDNHRHRPCHKIKKERYKKREVISSLICYSGEQQVIRKSAQLHGVTELSGEEFSAIE